MLSIWGFNDFLLLDFTHILRSRNVFLLAESTSQKLLYFSLSMHKYKLLCTTNFESCFSWQFFIIKFIHNMCRMLMPSITLSVPTKLYCLPFVSLQDLSMFILSVATITWEWSGSYFTTFPLAVSTLYRNTRQWLRAALLETPKSELGRLNIYINFF